MFHKKILILILSILSLFICVSVFIETNWPVIQVIFAISIISIFLIGDFRSDLQAWIILGLIAATVSFRYGQFVQPASLIGMDPDAYAVQVSRLVQGQPLSNIDFSFYDKAPVHLFLTVIIVYFTDMSVTSTMGIYPILIGITIPLLAAALARTLAPDRLSIEASIVAAAITSVEAYSIKFSIIPVAQTTAAIFWCMSILTLILYLRQRTLYWFVSFFLTVCALLFTHKLPLPLLAASMLAAAVGRRCVSALGEFDDLINSDITWIGIGIGLAVIQILFLTDFADNIAFKIITIFSSNLSIGAETLVIRTAAESPVTGTERFFSRFGASALLLTIGGLSSLYLVVNSEHRTTIGMPTMLSTIAVATLILFISIMTPVIAQPVRIFFVLGPLLAALIGITFSSVRESVYFSQEITEWGPRVAIAVIILTQLLVAPASIVYPEQPRMYLSSEEVSAKQWVYENIEGPVYADYYYSLEVIPSQVDDRARKDEPTIAGAGHQGQIKPLSSELTNASIQNEEYEHILHRNVAIYRTDSGIWILTWDYTDYLDTNYNSISDWGDVKYYMKT